MAVEPGNEIRESGTITLPAYQEPGVMVTAHFQKTLETDFRKGG